MSKSILTAAALFLAWNAAAADGPDFEKAVRANTPADQSVWIVVDRSDLARPEAAKFPLSAPVFTDSKTALFRVRPEMLPVVSEFMHDTFRRCGGFFAYRSKTAALAAQARASAVTVGGPYVLDQQAVVAPLMPKVQESNLRATIQSMAAFHNRYYTADTGVEAAHWVESRWREIAAKIPGASVSLFSHDGWAQPSVILTIPGSEKADEIVVLGGHLDSINGWGNAEARAPGADDNASGIAVLTETARILAESGFRPKRTIQFMGYAAEEVGLRGSQDIAERYAQTGKKVVAVIQYDMSNFKGSAEEIFLLTDNVDDTLSAFVGQLIDTYVGVKRSTTECGYACSDHASWTKQGFPSAMAFEASFDGMNHNIHTDHDNLTNSGGNADHSVPFAKLAVAFAVELAKSAPAAAGRALAASAPLR